MKSWSFWASLLLLASCELGGTNDFSAPNDLHASANSGKPTSYSVTFDANTGTGTMASQTFSVGTPTKLTKVSFTKENHTFVGWNTAADGSGTNYPDQTEFKIGFGDVALYATWTKLPLYLVDFDPNASDYTGTMASQSMPLDTPTALTPNGFMRTGYSFAGWALTQNTAVKYQDQDTYTIGPANVILFAKWTANTYVVSFKPNGADGAATMADESYVFGTTAALTSNAFTRTGYHFAGWSTTAIGQPTYTDGQSYSPTSANDLTLFAQWTPNVYTVTFDGNGNTGATSAMNPQSITYGTSPSLTPCTFTKTVGSQLQTFMGWSTDKNALSPSINDKAAYAIGAGNVTLFAVWNANSALAFDPNGGTGTMLNQSLSSSSTTAISTNLFSRVGYSFAGWKDAQVGGNAVTSPFPATPPGTPTTTLWAQWSINSYTVHFHDGAASATQSLVYNTTTALTANVFNKTGHTLSGWATTNGGPLAFGNGSNYTIAAADVDLYAVWTVNTYNLTFHDGLSSSTQSLSYNTPTALTSSVFTKTGYTLSWSNTNGGTTNYANGASYSIGAGDAHLYAVWTANTYTLTFHDGAATATQNLVYGSATALTSNVFTRTGYTLSWSTTDGGSTNFSNGASYTIGTSNADLYAVWTINSYTLTFHDGTSTSTQTLTYNTPTALTSNVFAKTGFTLSWSNTSGGTTSYTNGASYTIGAGSAHLYAVWTVNTYTLTFHNGASTATQTMAYQTATPLTPNVFTRTGYSLSWSNTSGGTAAYTNGANYSIGAGPDDLYAVWTANNYLVTFNVNGGSGGGSSQTFTYGNSTAIAGAVTIAMGSKTGYTLAGWARSAGASTPDYLVGASYASPGNSETLYAVWTINTYTLTFHDGASTATQTLTYNAPTALNSNVFAKTGYTLSWSTTNGGTTNYINGASYTIGAGNTDLHAVWTANTYTITFHDGAATATQNLIYGSATALTSNVFTKTGYTLSWSTTNGGSTNYTNGAPYTIGAANTNLYAVWTINTYTLTFHDGASSSTQPLTYNTPTALTSNVFTKTGHTLSWSNTNGGTTNYSNGASYTIGAGNADLYAVWTVNTYTMTFQTNGGTGGSMSPQTLTYGVATALTTVGFTRPGYTFAGWSTAAGVQTPTYSNTQLYTIGASNATLYAQWTANNYLVTFNVNGGSGGGSSQTFTYGTPAAIAGAVTTAMGSKTGYTLAGWARSAGASTPDYLVGANYSSPGNSETLYAVWTINTYTLTFHDGASTATQTLTYSAPTALNSNVFTKTGHTLSWSTTNGGTTNYTNGASYTIGAGNADLYAVWTINTYTLTFHDGASTATQTLTYNAPTALTSNVFTKSGSTLSWSTTNGGATNYANGASYTIGADNTDLYAVWTLNSYTLNFFSNGGTGSMSAQTLVYGVPTALSSVGFARTGYTFAGWSTTSGVQTPTYSNQQSYTIGAGNANLYAQWTVNTYKVTFNGYGSSSGTMADQTLTYGVSTALTGNSYQKTGYQFDGWSTSGGGAVAYLDLASYTIGAGAVTLYAHWTPKVYTHTFNGNGSTGGSMQASQNFTYDQPTTVVSNGFTKTGYTFTGWNTAQNGSGTSIINQASYLTPDSNQTFWAQWSENRDITSFVIQINTINYTGTITGTNIAVSIPFWSAVTSLAPTITTNSTNSTPVSPASMVGKDFTNPVTYTVTGAGNGTKTYTVTVTANYSTVSTYLGTAGSSGLLNATGTAARFWNPAGITVDSSGVLYIADRMNQVIRTVTTGGAVTTLAGTSQTVGYDSTHFYTPWGVAVNPSTNLVIVADNYNCSFRSVPTSGGSISILAGPPAGTSGVYGYVEGSPTTARFSFPEGVASSSTANYASDRSNNRIRKIANSGSTQLFAGSGTAALADGTSSGASFNNPRGLALSGSDLYVADYGNHAIRKINTTTQAVTTLAGTNTPGFVDGVGTAARFNHPTGVAVDSAGNVYVADSGNRAIRKIDTNGTVSTVAGNGTQGTADGVGTSARFDQIEGIAWFANRLYVTDYNQHTVRLLQ